MRTHSSTRYGAVAQALHWLTAILVLAAFAYGPGGSEARVYSDAKDWERRLHETLGLAVFALLLVRVAWRAVDRRPDSLPMARWMARSARIVQGLLYLLLLAAPATAVLGAWLDAHPLTLLGGLDIAPLVPPANALGESLAELHTWLGDAILWLAGLHAVAALFHHFVLRDDVLRAMLPRLGRGGMR